MHTTKAATLFALLAQAAFIAASPLPQTQDPDEAPDTGNEQDLELPPRQPDGAACVIDFSCESLACVAGKCEDVTDKECTKYTDCSTIGTFVCGEDQKCISEFGGEEEPADEPTEPACEPPEQEAEPEPEPEPEPECEPESEPEPEPECEPDDNEPDDNEPDDNEPDNNEPDDNGPDDNEPDDNEPDDNEPDDNEPDDNEPDDNEPDDNEPDDNEPDDTEPDNEPEPETEGQPED
ncbi:hypothetical protein AJ80_08744 [Polytolypa hystricis UAMH7299]|uniref:Uncharacterized protein n=1 Tax=Polytolypa hystricis (strain UAMH7299) TaxID=1447883 RepID=A0A2B7X2D0_POLH7|nr:hypothetical protein AJ80_08744 [Polytolypa hystricis UAMH7299]